MNNTEDRSTDMQQTSKLEMVACCTCGYEWPEGTNGTHSCVQIMSRTIERLKKELAAMTEAEHAISNAYVELRVILGAMNPPSTEFSVLTKYVSDIAKKIVEAHDDN